ncbi:MAG: hypothetical protein WDW36_003486 [Sanguina aurantia]
MSLLAFVCLVAAASAVAAFEPFSNAGAPPTVMGGVVTDDGSFLFKSKVGGYTTGKYSSWEFKPDSERAYFAISSQTTVLPDGTVLDQELCEFGYVFGIVWQVSESATTCPPPHRCAGRGGDDSMGGRYVRVPLALSAEQLTALGEGHAEEGAHTMAEPRVTA